MPKNTFMPSYYIVTRGHNPVKDSIFFCNNQILRFFVAHKVLPRAQYGLWGTPRILYRRRYMVADNSIYVLRQAVGEEFERVLPKRIQRPVYALPVDGLKGVEGA